MTDLSYRRQRRLSRGTQHPGTIEATDPHRADPGELFGPVPLVAALTAAIALLPWLIQLAPLQGALCLAQACTAAAGIARAAYPAFRPVAMVTFVFTFSWLGVAPVYQLATGTAAWRDGAVLLSPSTTPALMLLVFATAVLYVGFFRSGRTRAGPQKIQSAPITPSRGVCLAYVLACTALAPKAISTAGGFAAMFTSRTNRGEAFAAQGISLQELGGLQVALVGILPGALATAGAYLVLVRVLNQYRCGGLLGVNAVDAGLLVIGLTLVVVFANPFVNTRGLSAAAFGSLALLALQPRSRKAGVLMTVVLLTATLVLYPAANAFRGTQQSHQPHGFEFLATPDFDGFQQTINAVDFVGDLGHSFGMYSLSGVFYFVPRSMWTNKEQPASIDVATHRGYVFTNLSLPVQAEMYVDFGIVGMAVAMFLLASAGRRCDLDWAAGVRSRLAMTTPYASLACLSIIRGPIGANGPVYLTNLLLIGVGLLFATKSSAHSLTPQERKSSAPLTPVARQCLHANVRRGR